MTPLKLTEIFVREASETSHLETTAIVRTGQETVTVPDNAPIAKIPAWSKPDFTGLVRTQRRNAIITWPRTFSWKLQKAKQKYFFTKARRRRFLRHCFQALRRFQFPAGPLIPIHSWTDARATMPPAWTFRKQTRKSQVSLSARRDAPTILILTSELPRRRRAAGGTFP